VDECKSLKLGSERRDPDSLNTFVTAIVGRGLHSSTFQLNLSCF
jgi:hypothetical protein